MRKLVCLISIFGWHYYLNWCCLLATIANGFVLPTMPYRAASRTNNILATATMDEEELYDPVPSFSTSVCISKTMIPRRRRRWRFWKKPPSEPCHLEYSYEYNEMNVSSSDNGKTTGIVLIHPIGVGIGKWFYNRLYQSFRDLNNNNNNITNLSRNNLVLLAPDLLGSGTAFPIHDVKSISKHPPLLNISDWSDQILHLMTQVEQRTDIHNWCLVANGGCSPIALQVASKYYSNNYTTASLPQQPISHVLLSSVPRLSFFFRQSSDPTKVQKSYQTLCGIVGKLFWWYSCRNHGAFIQKFSERNLVANPENLGTAWRTNCYQIAAKHSQKSKYSTFAFLAGTLQDGCVESLNVLKKKNAKQNNKNIQIDIIRGRDVRKNNAKSWFWQTKRKQREPSDVTNNNTTIRDWIEENGLGGREVSIGGRISLAHEDPQGYRDAILSFLSKDD